MTVIRGLSQISYDWTIRVHADGSHHPDFGEQYKDSKLYMSQTEQSKDINLPLHKHLRLCFIHTIMYVEHVTNQLEFLPAQPGFCMLAGA
jgi:glucan phosphoethanolaminetransferase (alkaline phosphatase superfamily)